MTIKKIIFNCLPKNTQINIKDYWRRKKGLKLYNPLQYKNPIYASSIAALDYYKCIFVHIPKNAGISVAYTLFGNTGGSHRKIIDYKALFSKQTFNSYYKFTFVRNPWDRVVSTYFFLKNGGLTQKDKLWSETHLSEFNDFETFVLNWLNENNINKSLHFQHQHKFLENENQEIEVDFIGRFENLEEDFKTVTKKLGINRELKNKNKSKRRKDYKSYYNQETANIVALLYKKDIELFNYMF